MNPSTTTDPATTAPEHPPGAALSYVPITGNTYPVKDALRLQMDGIWSRSKKAWLVPADRAEEARALVATVPPKPAPAAARGGPRYRNQNSARPFRNRQVD